MTEKNLLELDEFPIMDASGKELKVGSKRIIGVHANRWNLLTIKLEGGGELPDGLKDQTFTNYKTCVTTIENFFRLREEQEKKEAEATRSYHKSRKPKEDNVEEVDAEEKGDS